MTVHPASVPSCLTDWVASLMQPGTLLKTIFLRVKSTVQNLKTLRPQLPMQCKQSYPEWRTNSKKKKMISIFGNGDVAAHHLALFRRASPLIKRIQLKLNWLRRITREGLTNTPIRFTLHTSVLFIDVSLSFACSKENPAFCSASSLLN